MGILIFILFYLLVGLGGDGSADQPKDWSYWLVAVLAVLVGAVIVILFVAAVLYFLLVWLDDGSRQWVAVLGILAGVVRIGAWYEGRQQQTEAR
jgi:hypothetical protein